MTFAELMYEIGTHSDGSSIYNPNVDKVGFYSNSDNTGDSFMFDMFGGTRADGSSQMGFMNGALGAASNLYGIYQGSQQLDLAKSQLAFQKSAWQEQFDIQKEEYDYQVQKRADRASNYADYQNKL